MTPVTVPLKRPPTSIGTAHAGPITHSRKKNDAASSRIEWSCRHHRRGNHEDAGKTEPGTATPRRASFALRVRLSTGPRSAADDVTGHAGEERNRSPQTERGNGQAAISRRYVGYHVR
jgi:hypothetical protein